ncbi:MAG: hypothetical protein IT558_03805 [Alphaproteobacteria bacterium]|nr:hypothetical protein [Alphaproteobacteria bacterium]
MLPARWYKAFFLALLFAAYTVQGVQAGNQGYEFSESEKVVFSFFKLANGSPDYEPWITHSRLYTNASEGKEQVLNSELARLKWGFETFNPEQDFITLKLKAVAEFRQQDKQALLDLAFDTPDHDIPPYFPYPYGRQFIALILADLANFKTITLSSKEEGVVKNFMNFGDKHPVEVFVVAKASKVDRDKPAQVDGMEQWLMMGEIGSVEVIYPAGEVSLPGTLLTFSAPWYVTEEETLKPPLLLLKE